MATLRVLEVLPGATSSGIWNDIKHELQFADSVEVVKVGGGGFELHLWFGTRADGSNVSGASTSKSY